MAIDLNSNTDSKLLDTRWHSLKLFNVYRMLIALMFLTTQKLLSPESIVQDLISQGRFSLAYESNLLNNLVLSYFIFSCLSAILTWLKKPNIDINLPTQMLIDISFIISIMYAQQDQPLGVGILLIIAIASASLISQGRLPLFYAAFATIGILFAQTLSFFASNKASESYTSSIMLSLSCFATAWLAYSLAKRAQVSETLAFERGTDVKNMAQINALIAHEMPAGILVMDQSFKIKHHNIQAKTLLDLDLDDLQHKSLNEVSPEINLIMQEWLHEPNQSNGSIKPNVIKINALSRELHLRFLPVSEIRSQGCVIFIEDWSQMQTQAHQIKLAALGRLTANIAHEIRNPLSAISHANQLLQEEDNSPSNERMLQIIADNVARVDQIIKDVLELNRRDRTNQETIDLGLFITDFYTQFCAVEKIPVPSFKLVICPSNTFISFDRRHLNQILWNLCKNGWRHCKQIDASMVLMVTALAKSQEVRIDVSDDGDGIAVEVRHHLFEPFFTTEKSGTGLGLYIARELADANGAKLLLKPHSNSLNKNISSNTTFSIHIKRF